MIAEYGAEYGERSADPPDKGGVGGGASVKLAAAVSSARVVRDAQGRASGRDASLIAGEHAPLHTSTSMLYVLYVLVVVGLPGKMYLTMKVLLIVRIVGIVALET